MDFLVLAKKRYSVRKFTNTKVEEEKIEKIIQAGMLAPTACNFQPQLIYTLKTSESLNILQKCKFSHFNEQLAFIVCYDKTKAWVREFDNKNSGEIDASIVATHMMLEATNLGIGSTWIMHFIPEAIKAEFGLDDNIIPVCILVMGYEESHNPSKMHDISKDINDVVIYK